MMMNDTEYLNLCDVLFEQLENWLDEREVDFDINGGVIEAQLENGDKIIINRQPPMREIWLAAPSGGRHFKWQNNGWKDTRDDNDLMDVLTKLID